MAKKKKSGAPKFRWWLFIAVGILLLISGGIYIRATSQSSHSSQPYWEQTAMVDQSGCDGIVSPEWIAHNGHFDGWTVYADYCPLQDQYYVTIESNSSFELDMLRDTGKNPECVPFLEDEGTIRMCLNQQAHQIESVSSP